jgi:hypothetical protein
MVLGTPQNQSSPLPENGLGRKLALYGPSVELYSELPELEKQIDATLGRFVVQELPESAGIIRGLLRRYSEAEVIRRLPLMAQPLHRQGDLTEIYHHEERYWTIDDRWGMSEINILRGQWQSWVLPQPKLDVVRLLEAAALWPLAQLLKAKNTWLAPSVSIARGTFGALMLSSIDLDSEVRALAEDGFRLIGQRWTVIREMDDQLELLQVPGGIRAITPAGFDGVAPWEDLTAGHADRSQQHAFCDAVVCIEAARRPRAGIRKIPQQDAAALLRRIWPIPELHPSRRSPQLPSKLAQNCGCFVLQLSREPADIIDLMQSIQGMPVRNRVA